MKIICGGKSRYMYTHTLFDGQIRFASSYPDTSTSGFRYDPEENKITFSFYTNHITLGGEYRCEIHQDVEEVLDVIPNLYKRHHHKSAALSHIAALKVLLAAENDEAKAA